MDKEIWRPIPEYENRYEVSNWGRVRSIKILKPFRDRNGYLKYLLSNPGKVKSYFIHRLVALAFIPNPENKPEVNHIDGNKQNNCADNLIFVTRSENMKHAYNNNLKVAKKGEKNYRARFTNKQVKQIRDEYIYGSREYGTNALAKKYGVARSTIEHIVNNKTYKNID